MSRVVEDTALLQIPLELGKNGVESVIDFWNDSTNEVKNLLANECDIIYQCRACGNFFRSLINFISHKRIFCRTLHAIQGEAVAKTQSQLAEELSNHINATSDEAQIPKKPRGLLKRTSIVGVLNKRIEHYEIKGLTASNKIEIMTLPRIAKSIPRTTFERGEQVLETMPCQMMMKEVLPKTRTALVLPQDNNVQYREMNLRRRDNNQKDNVVREISSEEVDLFSRLEKFTSGLVDFGSLRCLHYSCKTKKPFYSIYALAYHISIKHNYRLNNRISCFICGSTFFRYGALIGHLEKVHYDIYEKHHASRTSLLLEKDQKKFKKSKSMATVTATDLRSRSLSPLPNDTIPDEAFLESQQVFDDRDNKQSVFFSNISESSTEKSETSDLSDCSIAVKSARSSEDNWTLAEYRSDLLQLQRTLSLVRFKRPRSLSQIIQFLQANSEQNSGKLEMRNCEQAVLDCVENMIDKVCTRDLGVSIAGDCLNNQNAGNQPIFFSKETKFGDETNKFQVCEPELKEMLEDGAVVDVGLEVAANNNDFLPPLEEVKTIVMKSETADSVNDDKKSCLLEAGPFLVKAEDEKSLSVLSGSSTAGEHLDSKLANSEKIHENPASSQDRSSNADIMESDDEVETDSYDSSSRSQKQRKRDIRQRRVANLEKAREARKAMLNLGKSVEKPVQKSFDEMFLKHSEEPSRQQGSEEKVRSSSIVSSRPTRQRRKPNWIEDDSFMTTEFSRKRCRRNDDETVIDETNDSGSVEKNNTKLCHQSECLPKSESTCGVRAEDCGNRPRYKRISYDNSQPYHCSTSEASLLRSDVGANQGKMMSNVFPHPTAQVRRFDFGSHKTNLDNSEASTSSTNKHLEESSSVVRPDPATIPVYLTEAQRKLLFSFIVRYPSSSDNGYTCLHCTATFPDITEGRKHAVGHLRIIRLRCSLCGCGSFYCSDMRDHLQLRHCKMLHRAPAGYVLPGYQIPCMSYEQADNLTEVVDKAKPGRIMFTPGKIVSSGRLSPHYPDSEIEEKILGNKQSVNDEGVPQTYDALRIKLES